MQNLSCYGDSRYKGFCIHCGGPYETDDHIPSKVLLDEPYPGNLMVCPSCSDCNNSFSLDEEYFACLLECVIAGEAEPSKLQRNKIAEILTRNRPLLNRLRSARSDSDGVTLWTLENDRVRRVLLKLARGHASYEFNLPQFSEPDLFNFRPLLTLNAEERSRFEESDNGAEEILAGWPEVGSRAMQRLLVVGPQVFQEKWIEVQQGNYRFRVTEDDGLTVKIVLREYLACQVVWN
ncbi:MAG: hypothetical protein ABSC62_08535 [Terracidiphilus sp.]|jgi:hypothetical protein